MKNPPSFLSSYKFFDVFLVEEDFESYFSPSKVVHSSKKRLQRSCHAPLWWLRAIFYILFCSSSVERAANKRSVAFDLATTRDQHTEAPRCLVVGKSGRRGKRGREQKARRDEDDEKHRLLADGGEAKETRRQQKQRGNDDEVFPDLAFGRTSGN